jgi:hypothetical protein
MNFTFQVKGNVITLDINDKDLEIELEAADYSFAGYWGLSDHHINRASSFYLKRLKIANMDLATAHKRALTQEEFKKFLTDLDVDEIFADNFAKMAFNNLLR